MANARAKEVHNEYFWRNKKVVVVLNLADESIYTDVLRRSHSREAGKERKRCIHTALKIQNFLACPVDNLVAIIANQGGYKLNGTFTLPQDVRWHLLSFRDAGAIRIE
jgi:hypothetical protein